MAPIMRRLITGVVVALLALSTMVAPAYAATGNQGYAVYRDGVLPGGPEWHAAIMDKEHYNTPTYPVIHQPGNGYVRMATWSTFMDGNTYKGTYRPKVAPDPDYRDGFVYTARQLKDEQISYDPWAQVQYNSLTTGNYVFPEDITKMRCDGVIEYVYEWYYFRVFGSDAYWDVTWNNLATKVEHQSPVVSPRIQAQYYLTKVTSILP